MTDPVAKKRKFIITFAYWTLIFAIVYFLLKKAVIVCMPFVIAFVIAALLQPIISFISKKTKMKQRTASVVVVVLFFCTVGVLVAFGVFRVVMFCVDTISDLPTYYSETILPLIEKTLSDIQLKLRTFDPDITIEINTVMGWLASGLGDMTVLVEKSISFISEMPGFFVTTIITIISTFFISSDYGLITTWCLAQLNEKHRNTVLDVKQYVTEIVFKYIRSYALILLITFTELFAGLSVINLIFPKMLGGMGTVAVVALIIAVFDILPIVGTGTVLIPWGIIMLVIGSYGEGIALLALYIVVMIVRQIIEPKIVGGQVGLHPVVTLMAMIIGTALFGVLGLFGFPITLALVKELNNRGKIHIFKEIPKNQDVTVQTHPQDPNK